jgi:hypothetical protein
MIIPNKSTIAEEDPIEVPFGQGSPPHRGEVDDRDHDDDSDYGRPSSTRSPPLVPSSEPATGLSALTARLAAGNTGGGTAANDESDAPAGRSNDEYFTPSLYGRSSVASDRSGLGGHSRNPSRSGRNERELEGMKEELKREYEFKIATLQNKANGSDERVKLMEEELNSLKEVRAFCHYH